jgi:hypothetical protein
MTEILIVGEEMSNYFFKKNYKIKILSYGQIGDGTSGINRVYPVAVSNTTILSGNWILKISSGSDDNCGYTCAIVYFTIFTCFLKKTYDSDVCSGNCIKKFKKLKN